MLTLDAMLLSALVCSAVESHVRLTSDASSASNSVVMRRHMVRFPQRAECFADLKAERCCINCGEMMSEMSGYNISPQGNEFYKGNLTVMKGSLFNQPKQAVSHGYDVTVKGPHTRMTAHPYRATSNALKQLAWSTALHM
jgi:hypothetical protein